MRNENLTPCSHWPCSASPVLSLPQQEGRVCSGSAQCFAALGEAVLGSLEGLREPEDATGFGSTRGSRGEDALLSSPGFLSLKSCLCALPELGMEGEMWV